MDYDFQFSSAYFDREKNCRKMDMIRSDSFIKEIKAQFDTQEKWWIGEKKKFFLEKNYSLNNSISFLE